ncbi:MAG: glutathione S-transferase, partial [Betaproteobacteria bacterium]|nr:glutathione S-transferase [Betaproteobacteria bacterium]
MNHNLKLYIGNKNYSSWSMRPWVLMKQVDIAFDEVMVRFDDFTPDSHFKQTMGKLSASARVPVLVDRDLVIWDSLAIVEYLAEQFPEHSLWPEDREARARARSVCAEMHSGFGALRSACPMNIEASLPEIGALALRDKAAVRNDLARIEQMWSSLLARFGGPMLFGHGRNVIHGISRLIQAFLDQRFGRTAIFRPRGSFEFRGSSGAPHLSPGLPQVRCLSQPGNTQRLLTTSTMSAALCSP